jgi:hypothetical protein
MKQIESEKTLEARLVREIEARGGMALKYTSQFHRGIPDRIVLLPGGRAIFVELKSTGQKPTKLQMHAIKKLIQMGHWVEIIDRTGLLDSFLQVVDNIIRTSKPRPDEIIERLIPKTWDLPEDLGVVPEIAENAN